MIIDTHAHIDVSDYEEDREAVIERAREAGVQYMLNIGCDVESSYPDPPVTLFQRCCKLSGYFGMRCRSHRRPTTADFSEMAPFSARNRTAESRME